MSKKTKVKYRVILTFDVDVKGDTGVYKEISDLLDGEGLKQEFNNEKLPSNLYTGVRVATVEYESESLTMYAVEKRGERISQRYWNVVNKFFSSKKLEHSIFVSTSRLETTSIKHK
ncbi:hypothetical protein [Morganella morganii]|uniref:hypothetical protein n=1 Tax=Morganella morganii TaxID=582 RepID=UPI001BDB71E7|nr:hypothetical protein [Morganella morganii]MBT0497590.1 hypothetical protein [Morganella morganii subsp. morganii]QWL98013.1 hypothetical protein IZ183_05860 [Morganella morganii subsp. morganii]